MKGVGRGIPAADIFDVMENDGIGLNRRRLVRGHSADEPLEIKLRRHVRSTVAAGMLLRNFSAVRERRTGHTENHLRTAATASATLTTTTAARGTAARS